MKALGAGIFLGLFFISPVVVSAAGVKGDAAAGKTLYQQTCSACHGPEGKGDGPAAKALPVKPADHSDAAKMCDVSDDTLFKIIKEGGVAVGKSPIMAAWGPMLKEDKKMWDIVAYIRSLHEKGCKAKPAEKKVPAKK